MQPLLGERPNISPPLVINHSINFQNSESESISSLHPVEAETLRDDGVSNGETPMPDGDPFTPGAEHRAKKRRRLREPNKLMDTLMETLQEKWDENRKVDENIHEEERIRADKMLDIMAKSQQNMSNAVDVLKLIAEKM